VQEFPAFKQRLAELESKSLILDGEKLYFPWGDTPKSLDDLIFDEGVEMGVIDWETALAARQQEPAWLQGTTPPGGLCRRRRVPGDCAALLHPGAGERCAGRLQPPRF
jgi:hypothetical protein